SLWRRTTMPQMTRLSTMFTRIWERRRCSNVQQVMRGRAASSNLLFAAYDVEQESDMEFKTLQERLSKVVKGAAAQKKLLEILDGAGIPVKDIVDGKMVVLNRVLTPVQTQAMADVIRHYGNSKRERRRIAYEAAVEFQGKTTLNVRDFST